MQAVEHDVGTRTPWPVKLAAKVGIGLVPTRLSYAASRRLGVLRHGAMDDPDYALSVVHRHLDPLELPRGFRCVEIGPGDSIGSALITRALGASHSTLVDAGPFATTDMTGYSRLADRLKDLGLPSPSLQGCETLDELSARCGATYLTQGIDSWRTVATGSADVVWSHAVLEHVPLGEVDALLSETHRVLRPGGVASHRVDLKDHLSAALNNLRFPAPWWENRVVQRSTAYTNRIRFGEYIRRMESAGFEARVTNVDRWAVLPTPRARMARPFRELPEADLLVSGFDVTLRRLEHRAS